MGWTEAHSPRPLGGERDGLSVANVRGVVTGDERNKVWLIEARAAGKHRNVDACLVHHSHMQEDRRAAD